MSVTDQKAALREGLIRARPVVGPSDQAYLDPSLRNDWNSWGFFTRAEISALQPLYTWGALTNAISAAREGATIAGYDHQSEVVKLETQLYELYQSRLLSIELKRLVDEASKDFKKAEERLNEMLEEGEQDISEADVFKFQLFRHEFDARTHEVEQNLAFVESAWNVALSNADPTRVYEPSELYIDPIDTALSAYPVYEQWALQGRPDLRKANAAARAAHHGLQAARAQQYPSLYMAFTAAYAKTPNRPRQANPFIINNTNYESIRYGIGFRQNLNFGLIRNQIDRSRIQVEQARDAKSALESGMRLELLDSYKTASI
ncbi:MAG: TolC family protein, partial [Bacteroidetes bacterium]|nr:TolC family protein [Bacteroidota bacterium]